MKAPLGSLTYAQIRQMDQIAIPLIPSMGLSGAYIHAFEAVSPVQHDKIARKGDLFAKCQTQSL